MLSFRLKNHPGCNCHVDIDVYKKVIHFISYTTEILRCELEEDGLWSITCVGAYSHTDDTPFTKTTARQISWFLREYFPSVSYYTVKDAAIKNYVINSEFGARLSKDIGGHLV